MSCVQIYIKLSPYDQQSALLSLTDVEGLRFHQPLATSQWHWQITYSPLQQQWSNKTYMELIYSVLFMNSVMITDLQQL